MADLSSIPIFCDNIGNATEGLHCCYPATQDSPECRNSDLNADTLKWPCTDWISDCKNNSQLYGSETQDTTAGNGRALFRRYNVCANLPAIARYSSQGILNNDNFSSINHCFQQNNTYAELMNVTSAVTSCLTQTCRGARNSRACIQQCSPVRLLTNSTMPNISGLDTCLNSLCSGHYGSLPYADSDVIGIGVFSSYIMQCVLVSLLFLAFLGFERVLSRRRKRNVSLATTDLRTENGDPLLRQPHTSAEEYHTPPVGPSQSFDMVNLSTIKAKDSSNVMLSSDEDNFTKQLKSFDSLLIEFHKAQCYFSGTLQIASLAYDIFEVDMLKTFMLIPLATNGVLPVTFSYLLIFRWRHLPWRKEEQSSDIGVMLVTSACWILSTIVYWTLYAHLIPITNSQTRDTDPYQQFLYKLSARPACGDYSALALCQTDFFEGNAQIDSASRKLRRLTPIIWTFSTVCLLTVLLYQLYPRFQRKRQSRLKSSQQSNEGNGNAYQMLTEHSHRLFTAFFYLAMLFLLACIGMQLSLLAIGTSLKMMDRTYWSFGQIVAVTIWAPPLIGYAFSVVTTIKIRKLWGTYARVPRRGN